MSISIHNLKKRYFEGKEPKDVLKGVNLAVRPGEVYALTGANGAGKTTLLKILATLVLPDRGTATVAGHDIVAAAGKARRATGLVFDAERSFYQVLTVEDNLRFFAALYDVGDARSVIGRLLEDLRLAQWRRVRLSHCSSGIRQKLAIARAFLNDPEVILIDELTRSLDRQAADEVSAYIRRRVTAECKSCVLVTHDLPRAKAMGYRTGVLVNGVIKE